MAITPEFEVTHGKFIHNGKEIKPATYALNPAIQLKLWKISEQLTGISQPQSMT